MKIFLLKKIVFPVLQIIAKYKAKKKIKSKVEKSLYDTYKDYINKIIKKFVNPKPIKNPSIPPKQYGQYLQQTGKQIWVKKLK
jgi:hypothetical protein